MEDQQPLFEFNVDETSAGEIVEMTRWSKLFAILLSCVLVVAVLVLIMLSKRLSADLTAEMGDGKSLVLGFVYVLIILAIGVAAMMMFFLIRSANRIKNGLFRHDQALFNSGLNDLRIYFIFLGVVGILSLCSSLITLI
ncbi:MAG TPA: hypothetical protein VFZ42_01080 [Chitinophagaceae bacterium]